MSSDPGKSAGGATVFRRTLFTRCREYEIAALLEELATRAPGVAVAPGPKQDRDGSWVEIVLTSRDEGRLEAANSWLAERLPGQPAA